MAKYLAQGLWLLETMAPERGLSEFMETTDDGSVVCNGHISDGVAEAVAAETEKVWEAFMVRLAELGWPAHLVALANDRTMEDVALLHLGLTREAGHNPDELLRLSDQDMDDRRAHDATGLAEPGSVWETVDNIKVRFEAPGLLGFIKGLAAGFTTPELAPVNPADFGGVKPWMKFVQGHDGFGKFFRTALRPNFGFKVLCGGNQYWRGQYWSNRGPINVFARSEDYRVKALIGNVFVQLKYQKGGSLVLEETKVVPQAAIDRLWKAAGFNRAMVGPEFRPSRQDLLPVLGFSAA